MPSSSYLIFLVNVLIHVCTGLQLYTGGETLKSYHYIPFLLQKKKEPHCWPKPSCFLLPTCMMFSNILVFAYAPVMIGSDGTEWDTIQVILALAFDNNHIIYYDMDAQ